MSIPKVLALVGFCVLVAGCAPVTGAKGMIALGLSLFAVLAAGYGWISDRHEERVISKGEELEQAVTEHVREYHQSKPAGELAELSPQSARTNGRMSQRV